jgi:hypothetical protein
MVPDLLLTGAPPFQSTISGGIGLGMCRDAILYIKTVANCKTGYGQRWQGSCGSTLTQSAPLKLNPAKLLLLIACALRRWIGSLPVCLPPHGTSLRVLAPLLINCLCLKLTMLFRLLAAISVRSTSQPPGCCVFSPTSRHVFGRKRVGSLYCG